MPSDHLQPRYLTVVELTLNYALFGGVGYWAAGVIGACVGAGLVTARYGYLVLFAAGSAKSQRDAS